MRHLIHKLIVWCKGFRKNNFSQKCDLTGYNLVITSEGLELQTEYRLDSYSLISEEQLVDKHCRIE